MVMFFEGAQDHLKIDEIWKWFKFLFSVEMQDINELRELRLHLGLEESYPAIQSQCHWDVFRSPFLSNNFVRNFVFGGGSLFESIVKIFLCTHQLHQQIHPLLDRPVAMCPPCSWHQVVSVEGQVCLLFSLKKCTLQIQKGMIFHLISRESCSLLFHDFQFWKGKDVLVFVEEDGLFPKVFSNECSCGAHSRLHFSLATDHVQKAFQKDSVILPTCQETLTLGEDSIFCGYVSLLQFPTFGVAA